MTRSLRLVLAALALACSADRLTQPSLSLASLTETVTLIGAGDQHISCSSTGRDKQTAALVAAEPDALVFTAGDNTRDGAPEDFADCWPASWGQFKDRLYPTLGNHEMNWPAWQAGDATPYFDYFNGVGIDSGRAGKRDKGYYAVDHGAWLLLFLNTELQIGTDVYRFQRGMTEQAVWAAKLLRENPRRCQLAIWHKPRFTSGPLKPNKANLRPLWDTLTALRVELVISAHNHHYERFAPMRSTEVLDPLAPRQFVVGGGGHPSLSDFPYLHPRSEVRIKAWGVLWLELAPASYRWEYRELDGAVTDSGEGTCHPEGDSTPPDSIPADTAATDSVATDTVPADSVPPDTTPPPSITLTVTGELRSDDRTYSRLMWSGATGANVDVYRDGNFLTVQLNDGLYANSILYSGPVTYRYAVCETGSAVCSNDASVSYE